MDIEFVQEYIEKLIEENNAILKEKVILRSQCSLLSKRNEVLQKQVDEFEKEQEILRLQLEDLKEITLQKPKKVKFEQRDCHTD